MKKSPSSSLLSFLSLVVVIGWLPQSWAQPTFSGFRCGTNGNYTENSAFSEHLNTFLVTIISGKQLPDSNFYKLTNGSKPGIDFFSGTAICRADLSASNCYSCSSDAAGEIRQACPVQKQAFGWYRQCGIWYANSPHWGTSDTSPILHEITGNNASNPEAFDAQLKLLLMSLAAKAVGTYGRMKWATGSRVVNGSQSVYAVSQCVPDLGTQDCTKCLQALIDFIPTCCYGKTGSSIFGPNCATTFQNYHFYRTVDDHDLNSSKGNSERHRKLLQISLPIAISTFIVIFVAIGIWIFQRRKKAKQRNYNERTLLEENIKVVVETESSQFDLSSVKIATQNFSLDNKLGEGGFGEVYKGQLENGQQIAVKKLSQNSKQGFAEFKNELDLVAKLQHKNLVKLLGFCVASKELMLIYEFVPNASLDRLLFNVTKNILLDWGTRFKIIMGIARGLLYLHEDSRLKVIHRDLKTSNILLDEAMNPKISDFGLAKLFDMDETQAKTKRIVGTYGYMAPEYAVTGHFSVKSDVFSFGVIVLEIVSGQKNKYFGHSQVEEALLHRTWRLWNEKNVLDLVDPALENTYSVEEVTRCIYVGLLCVQEVPTERPSMSSIIAALKGESINLSEPKPPQFFGMDRWIRKSSDISHPDVRRQATQDFETSNSHSGATNITELYPR